MSLSLRMERKYEECIESAREEVFDWLIRTYCAASQRPFVNASQLTEEFLKAIKMGIDPEMAKEFEEWLG